MLVGNERSANPFYLLIVKNKVSGLRYSAKADLYSPPAPIQIVFTKALDGKGFEQEISSARMIPSSSWDAFRSEWDLESQTPNNEQAKAKGLLE
jgi:hypothetical protein